MNCSEKCRIVFLIPSLVRGGAEGQVWELIRRMDRSVFEPTLVLFDEVEEGYCRDAMNCDVHLLHASIGGNRRWFSKAFEHVTVTRRLYGYFRKASPLVVHTFLPAATILGQLAASMAGVPVKIAGRRSMPFYRRGAPVLSFADRYSLRFTDAVTVNCASIAHHTVEQDGFPEDRVFTIENGVDCERFKPGGDPRLRQRFGWSSENVVFGMTANFFGYKRHIDFLQAAAQIHFAFPQTRFLLVGREEDAFADAMKLRQELGLGHVVQIMATTQYPESVYAALDVYISTSATEGLSNVLLEAMACGLPIIASDVGGSPDLVSHGETGFLARPFAPGEITAFARALVSDGSLRRRFGEQACSIARERFSMDRMVRAHETLYLSLAKEKMTLAARSDLHLGTPSQSIS
jgi:glycosyltransferase involved in cell wall biosynthesis